MSQNIDKDLAAVLMAPGGPMEPRPGAQPEGARGIPEGTRGFSATFIGVSPAGVEWWAYRDRDIEPLRRRLVEIYARHRGRTAPRHRRVALTSGQADFITGVIDRLQAESPEETHAALGLKLGRTFVEAPEELLEYLADDAKMETESVSGMSFDIENWSEAREQFAIQARINGLQSLERKLRGLPPRKPLPRRRQRR